MAVLLDGEAISARIRATLATRVKSLPEAPRFAVLLVGSDPASHTYVNVKSRRAAEIGILCERYEYPADVREEVLLTKIEELNSRPDICGILLQLPLPSQDANRLIAAIDPRKDVDGFHPENVRALQHGRPCLVSPVALGAMKLIEHTNVSTKGLKGVVIASELFATPFITLLGERGVAAERKSKDDAALSQTLKDADIVIVAVGEPNMITGDMLKPGCIAIDVGTTNINGHLVGDIERSSAESVAGFLTPVPGGVGPMTVAMLLANVVKAAMTPW